MSDPTPLVTASRDALARELFLVDFPDRTQAEYIWAGLADDLLPKRSYFRKADALLASGVVRAVDGLAEDEALWTRLWEAVADVRDASPRLANDADTADIVEAALRVLAAALTTPTDPDEDEK